MIFQNYHKHTYYSNIKVSDSATSYEDYCKRAVELGHGIICSLEHGWQGRYIECHQLAEKYGLKFVFGTEAYWVKDRFALDENGHKDGSNCHICILAKNENGRQAINEILSQVAEEKMEAYYRQSRIDLPLIMTLPVDDVIITTACIAFWKYDDVDNIVKQLFNRFGKNFYLEVQYHNTASQKKINKHILELKKKYGIQLIMGCDSHYINEKGAIDRDEYIKSKGMEYPDENDWYMDYPDGQTAYKRFVEQCVLDHNQIMEAMNNTNIFLEVEEYDSPIFNHDIKMPELYPDLTQEERYELLENITMDSWQEYKKDVPENEWNAYEEQIKYELDIVKKTFHSDYFLIDNAIVKEGIKRGGQLTKTGRGSGVSFILNKLLGFTSVDRISAKVKMYPERFMSPTRILETHSLADIDMNVAKQEPFWEAQEALLGFDHSKQMIAYQQLKPAAAWKMYAKAQGIDFETANEVSDQIKKWQKAVAQADEDDKDNIDVLDYIDDEYKETYLKSTDYLGVVSSVSSHPCFDGEELVNTADGLMPIKNVCVGDMVLTKENEYKMVTNTFITDNAPIGIIDIQGRPKIKVTPNHPFLCKHMTRGKGNYREFSEEEWVNAEDLKNNDFVCAEIINNKSIIPTFMDVPTDNPTFWWIVGRYVGDGWLKKFYCNRPWEYIVTICVAFNQLEDITKELDKLGVYKYWVETSRTTYKVHINNKNLYYFLWQFGRGAGNKFIPNFVIDMPKNLLESMLDGYISADGCIRPNAIVATTISKKLALTLSSCIAKVYGTYAGVRSTLKKENILEGRILKANTQYLIRFNKERKQKDSYIVDEQNRIWVRFHNYVMLETVQTVYNFEVEDSHTYCVNNIVVHNCASLLYAGSIRKEIGYIFVKSQAGDGMLCCCMDGKWAEKYGFLKNDWLKVNVVEVIYKIFERIGMEPFSSTELIKRCENDDKVWGLYKKQCTKGLNQVEQPSSSTKVGAYAPTNISELTAFVAAVRPGFKSMYDIFESRKHFEYGIPAFDNLLQTDEMPNSFVLYQEQAMLTLNYAGIPMSECYAVIKAISKKRVEEITKNKAVFIEGFKKRLLEDKSITDMKAEETAHQVWQIIEDGSRYSFNCVAGTTRLFRDKGRTDYVPTIEEMYRIKHDLDFAKQTNHVSLHSKYLRTYGTCHSLCDNNTKVKKNDIIDIYYMGEKQTYRLTTRSGCVIECTEDHKFPTPFGNKELSELKVGDKLYKKGLYEKNTTNYKFTDGNFENNFPKKGQCGFRKREDGDSVLYNKFRSMCKAEIRCCEDCGREYSDDYRFEVHHEDFDRTNNSFDNYAWLCVSCHKKRHYANGRVKKSDKGYPVVEDEIISIEDAGVQSVYDIEMADPNHTFTIDNGLIVCNCSHAYSVALDSLYEAWLKAYYPLEFYETYLNILNEKGDKDRLNKFKEEAEHYFGIVFPPYRFRQDNRTITIDKEHNAINNALSSIKGYSNQIAEELYQCGLKCKSFIHVLKYLDDRSIKSAKLIPLIKIGYFSEFGNENALLKFVDYWDILKQGMAKQLSKDKTDDLLNSLLPYYATDKNKDGSEAKSWKLITAQMYDFLKDIYKECLEEEPPTYKYKMQWQQEILGYIELTTGKKEDTKKILILDVKPLIGQYSPDPWCYKVETRSIGTGRTASLNIDARTWQNCGPVVSMDIINVGRVGKNKKGYWYLYDYEKEWV